MQYMQYKPHRTQKNRTKDVKKDKTLKNQTTTGQESGNTFKLQLLISKGLVQGNDSG